MAHDLAAAAECRGRGGLPNAYEKLRKGAPVCVAYLGGSITAQDGWRPKTRDWLRQQFPAAEVSEINAAIGGTGSDLGVFRLKDGRHISVKNAPTRFGPVAFEIHSHLAQGFIEARVEPPTRLAPRQVILRLRHPQGKLMRAVIVNDKRHRGFDARREIVTIEPGAMPIKLRAEF